VLELLERAVPAGARRDHLAQQVLATVLARGTGPALAKERSAERREAAQATARDLLARFMTEAVLHALPSGLGVRYRLLEHGFFAEAEAVAAHQQRKAPTPRLVEDGRLYAQYPFFRDPARPVPDELYDVSHELTVTHRLTRLAWSGRTLQIEGIGFFEQLSTRDRDSELVLRERRTGAVERFPVEAVKDPTLLNAKGRPRSMGRFRRSLDLAMPPSGLVLGPGLWEVRLSVSFEGVSREVPFGSVRSSDADLLARESVVILPAPDEAGQELVARHVVLPSGDRAIEVSERSPARRSTEDADVRSPALAD
jgi:poly(ribitol-phosphate) beta-N-acetylglucosaminyltransferase